MQLLKVRQTVQAHMRPESNGGWGAAAASFFVGLKFDRLPVICWLFDLSRFKPTFVVIPDVVVVLGSVCCCCIVVATTVRPTKLNTGSKNEWQAAVKLNPWALFATSSSSSSEVGRGGRACLCVCIWIWLAGICLCHKSACVWNVCVYVNVCVCMKCMCVCVCLYVCL